VDQAGEAARSLAGVLIALALSVAMTVMIGSFRDSLQGWLDQVLPADLYVRSALRDAAGQPSPLDPALLQPLPGVARAAPQRSSSVWVGDAVRPLPLQARELDEARLPLMGALAAPTEPGRTPVFINEAAAATLQLAPGQPLSLRLRADGPALPAFVRGIWRDYAHPNGALWMGLADYRRLSGDPLATELALWLAPGADAAAVQKDLRARAAARDDIEIASATELRTLSLSIFDRSFAITVWLQGVALGVGLFGVAAGQSAQALARRREFGLLRHLGLSAGAVQRLLLLEAGVMSGVGALAGLALGLALSAVLVFVVNPQSFHWSMDMHVPVTRLAALLAVAFAASTGAAALAGRRALGADAVRAVKEDW
jgi:putative ABC transport system permease protein